MPQADADGSGLHILPSSWMLLAAQTFWSSAVACGETAVPVTWSSRTPDCGSAAARRSTDSSWTCGFCERKPGLSDR